MKKIILYTVIIFTFSNCQNKKNKTSVAVEQIKDINGIVEAIIIQDSLDVFFKSEDSTMFCSELRKLKISIPEKTKEGLIPPLSDREIYISDLLYNHPKEEVFFSVNDSLYLLKQNSNPQKLKIERNLLNKLNTTTVEKALIKRKNAEMFWFYQMTIPVFSLDRQKAYAQLDCFCTGLCGSGQAIFLEKINGKWKIIKKRQTWIS